MNNDEPVYYEPEPVGDEKPIEYVEPPFDAVPEELPPEDSPIKQSDKKPTVAWIVGIVVFVLILFAVIYWSYTHDSYTPIDNNISNDSYVEKVPLYRVIMPDGTLDSHLFAYDNESGLYNMVNFTGDFSQCTIITCPCAINTTAPCMAMCYDCG
jgi:hypothetical protein